MSTNKPIKPTDIVQFSQGPKKGLLAQVILLEGELKFLCRDWDGSQRVFVADEDEPFFIVGTAALGPGIGVSPTASAPVQPAVPPPLNPEELLAPLPPEVKAQPMNYEVQESKAKKAAGKLREKIRALPKVTLTATVKNALGDEARVTVQGRAGLSKNRYIGTAIIRAIRVIEHKVPMTVTWEPSPST